MSLNQRVLLLALLVVALVIVIRQIVVYSRLNGRADRAVRLLLETCRQSGRDIRACEYIEIDNTCITVSFGDDCPKMICNKAGVWDDSAACRKKKYYARQLRKKLGLSDYIYFVGDGFYTVPNATNYQFASNGRDSVTVTQSPKTNSYKRVFLCSRQNKARLKALR